MANERIDWADVSKRLVRYAHACLHRKSWEEAESDYVTLVLRASPAKLVRSRSFDGLRSLAQHPRDESESEESIHTTSGR